MKKFVIIIVSFFCLGASNGDCSEMGVEFEYQTNLGSRYGIFAPSTKTTYGELKDLISKKTGKEVRSLSFYGQPVDTNEKVDSTLSGEISVTFKKRIPPVPEKIESLQELLSYAKSEVTTKEDVIKAIEQLMTKGHP